jgi:hypothetical protein
MKMSREDVIRRIVERDLKKLGLAESIVQAEAPDLVREACDAFGTWETALQYSGASRRTRRRRAGFPIVQVNGHPTPPVDPDCDIARRLLDLQAQGRPIVYSLLVFECDELLKDAVRRYGTWLRALDAIGIDRQPSRREPWTRDAILDGIRELQARGASMKCSHVRADHQGLVSASRAYFTKWEDAVAAAFGACAARPTTDENGPSEGPSSRESEHRLSS